MVRLHAQSGLYQLSPESENLTASIATSASSAAFDRVERCDPCLGQDFTAMPGAHLSISNVFPALRGHGRLLLTPSLQ